MATPDARADADRHTAAHRDRDPLVSTRRLIVDGTNLLHALSRTPGGAPPAALIGRLRAAIPATIIVELVFDGPAERGLRNERIAAGVKVRYAGNRTADAAILATIDETRAVDGAPGADAVLVVTDDRELRHGARLRGARTAGSRWLLGRLDTGRLSSPSVGNPRPPKDTTGGDQAGHDPAVDADEDRPGWRPGRGATTKRGNPRKAPRGRGAGRMPP